MKKLMIVLLMFSCGDEKNQDVIYIKDKDIWMDKNEVTVQSFDLFIASTDYTTTADSLKWSPYFSVKSKSWDLDTLLNWRNPYPRYIAKANEPVTQVSYYDACAYCLWKKGRLPTAEEWDIAAGKEIIVGNIWQGNFPFEDLGTDGYKAQVAPVGLFESNQNGFNDMFGNVWEWTNTNDVHPTTFEKGKIIKGGSFLCEPNFCKGYQPRFYQVTPLNSGGNHLGFRCVYKNK